MFDIVFVITNFCEQLLKAKKSRHKLCLAVSILFPKRIYFTIHCRKRTRRSKACINIRTTASSLVLVVFWFLVLQFCVRVIFAVLLHMMDSRPGRSGTRSDSGWVLRIFGFSDRGTESVRVILYFGSGSGSGYFGYN